MVLSALISGLPVSAQGLLSDALSSVFGEGVVGVTNLEKDNLRQRVRLSKKNTADVLVVLDQVSKDACKDIENGLYNSDKFFTYKDDEGFVSFLNNKYGLSLEVPKNNLEVVENTKEPVSIDTNIIKKYEARIADRDLIIKNLQLRVSELQNTINLGGYEEGIIDLSLLESKDPEAVSELKDENLELRDKISGLSNELEGLRQSESNLQKGYNSLKAKVEELKTKKTELSDSLAGVSEELTNYKVKYSNQTGLLRNKDTEIETLKRKLADSLRFETDLSICRSEKEDLNKKITELNSLITQYKVDLQSKDRDIEGLKEKLVEVDYSNEAQERAEAKLKEVESERDDLFKQVVEKGKEYCELQSEYESTLSSLNSERSRVSGLESEIDELQAKVSEQDDTVLELNKQKIELSSQLEVLQKSTDRDSDIETILAESSSIKEKYAKLKESVFNRIASSALPKQASSVQLISGHKYSNVMFAFAGSTESRKGAYKCLLNELRKVKDDVIIVDVVSETSIDYVFEVKKVVPGIMWFVKGGGVQSYLSSTCINNVKVLSPGLGYINDSYFLTVNWERRLAELENSGYKVIVFCGDVSNVVGRVMHESFANCGKSNIYVHGNAIGSRTAVANKMGISNFKQSKICYFEFNKQMQRFYDIVAKDCACEVVDGN